MDEFDDEEFVAIMAANAATVAACYYYEHYISKNPCRDSALSGKEYMKELLNGHGGRIRENLRMDRHVFLKLCDILKVEGLLHSTRGVSVEEQLAIFLLTIGHNERNRVVQERFQHFGETISRHFNTVLDAIVALAPNFFQSPGLDTPKEILNDLRFYPYFKDCVGAINRTHIPAMIRVDDQGPFRNRKQIITQNVLAACSFDLQFQYVLAGWEGSASDSRVLYAAITRDNKLEIPEGKYYLVDAGFTNLQGFIAPYRGIRYHWNEFSSNSNPSNAKEMFNHRHYSLKNAIERIFGVLKSRFPILTTPPPYPFETQVKLVIAACVIHNHIRKENRNDWIFNMEFEREDREGIDEQETQTGTQGSEANSRMRRREIANELRESITNLMWNEQNNGFGF